MALQVVKPIVKWAGGKSQLIEDIKSRLPSLTQTQDFCMIEPFLGGGAVSFWALSKLPHLKQLIINDTNQDLINLYQVIKTDMEPLLEALQQLQSEYDELTTKAEKSPYFYAKRQQFNRRDNDAVIQASLA